MSLNPFSKNFENDYNLLVERVAELERAAEEARRVSGTMYDRLGEGGGSEQFILFCNIKSGDPTAILDEKEEGKPPEGDEDSNPPEGEEDELPRTFYVIEPAIQYYKYLYQPMVTEEEEEQGLRRYGPSGLAEDGEEEPPVPLPSASKLLQNIGAPLWLRSEMENGTFIGENACDYRYKPQGDEEGAVMKNLHGVQAPNDPAVSGNFGVINVRPLENPAPSNGIGCVPVIFTRTSRGVHVGIYGKNDLGVSCAQANEENEGLKARVRGARKRWLSRKSKNMGATADSRQTGRGRTTGGY